MLILLLTYFFTSLRCSYIWWQAETLSIWQSEQLVVVQNRVKIFHPLGINVSIKDDPLSLLQLTSNIVNDPEVEIQSKTFSK